ncbi:MAG TPA: PepSY-associated TM helix domain-containing protein [Terriglobia bacterium]|nr:PepSY-associated TM helix domain-containing protein [Terriglobia bacterium]
MTFWSLWKTRPRESRLRRALFQIHLWSGLCLGVYVLVLSVSGSALVFRNDLYNAFTAPPVILKAQGERLSAEAIRSAARAAHPGYEISRVWENETNPAQAIEITLDRGGHEIQRLFDPYSGRDLGHAIPAGIRLMSWLEDLHVNLLAGESGRLVNGTAAALWVALGLTGAVIWWPGLRDWRRAMGVRWRANWRRFNFDLHSAVGIWTLLFFLLWGITGVHVAIPRPFWAVVDYLEPPPETYQPGMRTGEVILRWSSRLHFGTIGGRVTQAIWVVIGLAPAVLFVTGVVMWWNRVLRRRDL